MKNKKLALISILVAVLIILFILAPKKTISFEIEDKCGRFINLKSHTIEDEDSCKTRCSAQCRSLDKPYKKAEYKNNNESCNFCKCYCK